LRAGGTASTQAWQPWGSGSISTGSYLARVRVRVRVRVRARVRVRVRVSLWWRLDGEGVVPRGAPRVTAVRRGLHLVRARVRVRA